MSEDESERAQPHATYANYFTVGYNTAEFLIDFGQLYSTMREPQLHTRIVTGPVFAKALSAVLRDSIERYEEEFGMIPEEVDNDA